MQIVDIKDRVAISLACRELAQGNLIIFPTETCYGLGVDATNKEAVSKLMQYKGDRYRQVSIAVKDQEMALNYVELNELAFNLYQEFLPGPLTVISKSRGKTIELLESKDGTLGIRIPNYAFALELITKYGKPITATSANTSGKKEPYSFADWQKYTASGKQSMISLFLDAGTLQDRPTSTVVDTTLNDPLILRQGEFVLPTNSPTIRTKGAENTSSEGAIILQKHLGLLSRFPLVIALQGELGVGKTQIVKGMAKKMGVKNLITSPTYTIAKEYQYKTEKYEGTLYHLDTWRLRDLEDLESTLNLSSYLRPGNIIAIEWAGKVKNELTKLKKDYPFLLINIQDLGGNNRSISYTFSTPEWS